MNANRCPASNAVISETPAWSGRFLWRPLLACAISLACLALSSASSQAAVAATLIWDANAAGGGSDGSGTWSTANSWWNGTADQTWVDNTIGCIIGTNTPGNYTINLSSAVVTTNVTFKTNTYTLTGSQLTYTSMTLPSGVSANVNCPLRTSGGGCSVGGGGATLTLGGNYASVGGNPNFNGTTLATSTLNITNGTQTSAGTETYNNITVNQSGGAIAFAIWNIGRTAAATYNLSGGTLRNTTSGAWSVSRGFTSIFNLSGAGLLGAVGNANIAGNTTTDNGTFNVLGGTANIGTGIGGTPGVSSASLANINMLALGSAGTYTAAAKAALNISGGITTAKGIQFGSSVSSYVNNPSCNFTMTGGLLYLDVNGIALGSGVSGLNKQTNTLSGGTIGATANWIGSVPMTLTNVPNDVTFQAADINGTPFNITLAGALSGVGGLIKTGGGILTLSGANSYTGTTAVTNGQLTVSAAGATSIGPVTLATGTALSTVLAAAGKSWTNAGLIITNSVVIDFNFGGFQASPSARVIQVNGDLTLDSSDTCTIEGTAILTGTFPLITCTGALTLTGGTTLPAITSLPSGVTATLVRSGKTINLVVTASPNSPLNWGALAAGPWDFTTTDWVNAGNGSPTNYSDGVAVTFNDNSNSTVVITLNTNVQPVSVTANNNSSGTTSYSIVGKGSISGGTSVLIQGTGLVALGTTNTYSGGTTVNSGTLGINYGGDGSGPSAIGTGTLTLNPGATFDNTSGSNVVLNTPLQENWNGNITYAGSQANLDLETGPVILGSSLTVAVSSNLLAVGSVISDNGLNYGLTVQGPGALTLSGFNNYGGGTILNSGKLNINNGGDGGPDSAIGTGQFTINGGTIDNTSGAAVQLQTGITEAWNANFIFAGSTNLDLGAGTINASALTLTLQNGATLRSEGGMVAVGSGAVATMTVAGNGTLQTSGTHNNPGLTFVVAGPTLLLDKSSSASVHSVGGGLVISNGLAKVTGTGGRQIINTSVGPVTLSGGTLDLFGSSESIFSLTFNSGTLLNENTPATLTLASIINIKGAACNFDTETNGDLSIPGTISGIGTLVKSGAASLSLGGTNTYTGSTIVSNGLLLISTATLASRNYTVAAGELEAMLDPTGAALQMTMSNLLFGTNTRLGFDLAAGAFGDTTSSLIAADSVTMNGNVAVDVTNAPADTADDVLLSYNSRSGTGLFVAGSIPVGAYVYDNTAAHKVILTYTNPPPPAPIFSGIAGIQTGGSLTGLTFSGANGIPGNSYHILSSTNVALQPLSAWTPVTNGTFDVSGKFTTTISVNPAVPRTFYLLSVP